MISAFLAALLARHILAGEFQQAAHLANSLATRSEAFIQKLEAYPCR